MTIPSLATRIRVTRALFTILITIYLQFLVLQWVTIIVPRLLEFIDVKNSRNSILLLLCTYQNDNINYKSRHLERKKNA